MPTLGNKRYETMAQAMARGAPQGQAYKEAGFSGGRSSASRVANLPEVKDRIEELRAEYRAQAMARYSGVSTNEGESLSLDWCAQAFYGVFQKAYDKGDLKTAMDSVNHIMRLIETGAGTPKERGGKVDVAAMLSGLDAAMKLMEAQEKSVARDNLLLAQERSIEAEEAGEYRLAA